MVAGHDTVAADGLLVHLAVQVKRLRGTKERQNHQLCPSKHPLLVSKGVEKTTNDLYLSASGNKLLKHILKVS